MYRISLRDIESKTIQITPPFPPKTTLGTAPLLQNFEGYFLGGRGQIPRVGYGQIACADPSRGNGQKRRIFVHMGWLELCRNEIPGRAMGLPQMDHQLSLVLLVNLHHLSKSRLLLHDKQNE